MSLKTALKKIFKPTKTKIVGISAFMILVGGIGASVHSTADATCYGDANANAVIYCGAPTMSDLTTDYSGNVQGVKQVYSSSPFNMDESTFKDFESHYVMGEVYSNGNVEVGNTVVATNAWTAGRDSLDNNSTCDDQYKNSAGVYVRHPSCSFVSSPLEAFVYMPNNQFEFAVLLACGNPVIGTPVKTTTPPPAPKVPNYTITKSVSYQGKGWVHEVTAPVNGVVQYKIDVKSTGTAPVTHVYVNDAISANIQYVPGTLKINGNPVGDASTKDFFSKGLQIAGLNPGDSTEITFNAKVGVLYTTQNCKPGPFINNAFVNATSLPQKGANALVDEKCTPPAETLVCTDLTFGATGPADSEGNVPYRFIGSATPTNAKIKSYTFVLKDSSGNTIYTKTTKGGGTKTPFSYTLAPGQYDASLTVSGVGNDGKAFTDITSDACAQHITVSSTPVCTAPNGSTYPEGSAQCSPSTTCTSPSGQTYPVGSSECQTTTTGTTSLVNTGPGNVIAVFAGASGLGALGHWFLTVRKAKKAIGLK